MSGRAGDLGRGVAIAIGFVVRGRSNSAAETPIERTSQFAPISRDSAWQERRRAPTCAHRQTWADSILARCDREESIRAIAAGMASR